MRLRLLLSAISLFLFCSLHAQDLNIKIISDPGYEREHFEMYRSDLLGIIGSKYQVSLEEDDIYFHDLSRKDINNKFNELSNDPDVDLIIVYGTYVATQLTTVEEYLKPTIVFGVINPTIQGYPMTHEGTSGVHNLAYISLNSNRSELFDFYEIYPFEEIAIILDYRVAEVVRANEYLEDIFEVIPSRYVMIGSDDDPEAVLKAIPESVDAVLFGPMLGMTEEHKSDVIDALNIGRYPTLSLAGDVLDSKSLIFRSTEEDMPQIMRRLALQTEDIFVNKKDASSLKVEIDLKYPIIINMAIADLIDFSPSFDVLEKYPTINRDEVFTGKEYSFEQVVERVMDANLTISSANYRFESTAREVGISRAQILPFINATVDATINDPNYAEATGGLFPQYVVGGKLQFEQLVYSELPFTQVRIQKTLRAAAEYGYQEEVLDVMLDGMVSYLNILRSEAQLRIRESNKEITQINLNIANQRLQVGYSGRSEVYRWESNLAIASQDVVAARNELHQAKISLSKLMNFPLNEDFDLVDASLSSYPFDRYEEESLAGYVANDQGLEKGMEWLFVQAQESLPGLMQIDENVRAIEQRLGMFSRDRFIPDVSVFANGTGNFYRGGAGFDPGGIGLVAPKYFWSVGAVASIPLFRGSERNVQVQQSKIDLMLQENEKQRFLLDLEEAIRQQVLNVVTASTNITFTKEAADAASKALDLTQDSYSEGTVSIVELIDAQNNALSAELAYINSEYNYLINVLQLERLTGSFLLVRSKDENMQLINDFLQFDPNPENE